MTFAEATYVEPEYAFITMLMRLRPARDIGRVFLRRGLREHVSEDSLLYHGSQREGSARA